MCLIATATYGSELSPEVQFLRNFRDDAILKTKTGSSFMVAFNAWYYSFSPAVAQLIQEHPTLKTATRLTLYPLIGILRIGAEAFHLVPANMEAAAVVSGLVVSTLIGVIYLSTPLTAVLAYSSRIRRAAKRVQLPVTRAFFGSLATIALTMVLGGPTVLITLETSALVLASLTSSALFASQSILRLLNRR